MPHSHDSRGERGGLSYVVLVLLLTLVSSANGRECGENPMKQVLLIAKRTGRSLDNVLTVLRDVAAPTYEELARRFRMYAACVGLVDTGYFRKRSDAPGLSYLRHIKADPERQPDPRGPEGVLRPAVDGRWASLVSALPLSPFAVIPSNPSLEIRAPSIALRAASRPSDVISNSNAPRHLAVVTRQPDNSAVHGTRATLRSGTGDSGLSEDGYSEEIDNLAPTSQHRTGQILIIPTGVGLSNPANKNNNNEISPWDEPNASNRHYLTSYDDDDDITVHDVGYQTLSPRSSPSNKRRYPANSGEQRMDDAADMSRSLKAIIRKARLILDAGRRLSAERATRNGGGSRHGRDRDEEEDIDDSSRQISPLDETPNMFK